ncbi:MAG: host-nuclease inhibitor Gam family protein [Mucinivorans sp.]
MAKTRQTKKVLIAVSREQAEEAFAAYAAADARIQQLTAKMDGEITKIRERYQDELTEKGEAKCRAFEVMESFAMANREELFTKKKSLDMTHGVLGFRTGTPQIKNRKGFTWSAVTKMLKEFLPDYIRTKEEPDKERLLADRTKDKVAAQFERCGIMVAQDEAFYVEPKKEEV